MDLRALQARLSGNLATVPSRLRGPAAVNMTCQAAYGERPQLRLIHPTATPLMLPYSFLHQFPSHL